MVGNNSRPTPLDSENKREQLSTGLSIESRRAIGSAGLPTLLGTSSFMMSCSTLLVLVSLLLMVQAWAGMETPLDSENKSEQLSTDLGGLSIESKENEMKITLLLKKLKKENSLKTKEINQIKEEIKLVKGFSSALLVVLVVLVVVVIIYEKGSRKTGTNKLIKTKLIGKTTPCGKIQHEYKKLLCALLNTECALLSENSLDDDLSIESIDLLKENWPRLIEILLPSLSSNLINHAKKISFYNCGSYDAEDIVCTSLKIMTKFAKMQVFGISEANIALFHIGINLPIKHKNELSDTESEVIFCLTLENTRDFEIYSEETKIKLCETIENGINNAIKSPKKIEWLKNFLREDETFSESPDIDFDKISIKVKDIFPGSHKVIIQFRNVNFPENPEEVNNILKVVQILLENLPSLEKVCVDEQPDRPEDGIMRMRIHVGNKYLTWNNKKKLKECLETIIEDVRNLSLERNVIEEKLLSLGVAPISIEKLLENLSEPDKIEIDLQPPKKLHLETMRLKNIPLWPCDKRRLLEISNQNQFDIANLFTKTFAKEISWEDVATELDVLNNNDTYVKLQNDVSKLGTMSPYPAIIKTYKEKSGTIGGLLKCLETIRNNEELTNHLKSKIDDLISYIHAIKESHFREWSKNYDKHKKQRGSFVDSYYDLERVVTNSTDKGCVIPVWNWKEVIKEGDQIWMWREANFYKPAYAHVGIFIGQDSMVHVQQEGLSGIITKGSVADVINGSNCFIVRPHPETLEMISGTPRERALACLGLKFTYSVNSGNCEVFANIVCHGTWYVCDSVQGDEHPHMNRLVTVFNGLSHFKTYQTQQKSLVSKLAKRLLLEGIIDQNMIQINKAFEVHENIHTDITHEMFKETKLERYRLIMAWKILEGISSEEQLFKSDWSNKEIGRTGKNRKKTFQSNVLELFNRLPKQIRNISSCSIEDFVKSLDPHLISIQDCNLESGLSDMDPAILPADSSCNGISVPTTSRHTSPTASDSSFDNSTYELIDQDSDADFYRT